MCTNKNVRDLIEEISGIDPKEYSLELILTFDNSGSNNLNAILMSVYNITSKIGEMMKTYLKKLLRNSVTITIIIIKKLNLLKISDYLSK